MKKTFLSTGFLIAALALEGAVTDVTFAQRWPWSRVVDIDYTVTGTQEKDIVATATWQGQATPVPLEGSSITGDLYMVSHGERHAVWDPAMAGYGAAELKDFRVNLQTVDSSNALSRTYLVLDLANDSYSFTNAPPASGWNGDNAYFRSKMVFRRIPAGTFQMGYSDDLRTKLSMSDACTKQRTVTLTHDYYLGVFDVTYGHYHAITSRLGGVKGSAISYGTDSRNSRTMSYNDWRGSKEQGIDWPGTYYEVAPDSGIGKVRRFFAENLKLPSGWVADMPTSAQWEYAAKATTPVGQIWSSGGTVDSTMAELTNCVNQVAIWKPYRTGGISVGYRQPNGWGLYDMAGCRCQWVLDYYQSDALTETVDPRGPQLTTTSRMFRGGNADCTAFKSLTPAYPSGDNCGTVTWHTTRICINIGIPEK